MLLRRRAHGSAADTVTVPGKGYVQVFEDDPGSRLGRTGGDGSVGGRRRGFVRPLDEVATTQVVVGDQGEVRFDFSNRGFVWDDEQAFAKVYGHWDGRN